MNDDEKYLKHWGVRGMRWGHRKAEDSSSSKKGRSSFEAIFKPGKSVHAEDVNAKILEKNPNAAVVNYAALKKSGTKSSRKTKETKLSPEQIAARNKRIRNIAIGVGVGLTVVAATALYLKNKPAVDNYVKGFLDKSKAKKVTELLDENQLSPAEVKAYNKLGLKDVKTKQDAVIANWVASWLGHDKTRYDAISSDAYKRLDDNDLSLKTGQILKRISMSGETEVRNNTFVSFEPDDNARYAAFLPGLWKANLDLPVKPPTFSVSMEAITDIKSPSAKKRIDILADLIKNDTSFRESLLNKSGNLPKYYAYSERKALADPLFYAREKYNLLATNLGNRDSDVTKRYLAEIRRLGYNAIVDDNDAGRLTKNPLILLDAKAVVFKEAKKLSHTDFASALSSIKPMGNESIERTRKVFNIQPQIVEKIMGGPKIGPKDYTNPFIQAISGM